jgi:hypothetical protein
MRLRQHNIKLQNTSLQSVFTVTSQHISLNFYRLQENKIGAIIMSHVRAIQDNVTHKASP